MNLKSSFKRTIKSKGARPFLIAGFLSNLGDWIYFVGMSAFMYNQFGPVAIGLLSIIRQAAGMLFAPIAGYLSDKYSKKNLILLSNVFSALLMLVLLMFTLQNKHYLFLYLIVGILLTLVASIDRIATLSLVPSLVNKEDRLALNSLLNTVGTVSLMIAPIFGGLLLSSNALSLNFIFNSISFMISFFLILSVPSNIENEDKNNSLKTEENKNSHSLKSTYQTWTLGIKYIFNDKQIRPLTILMMLNHVVVGTTWVFTPKLAELIGQKNVGIGYLLTAIGIGSIIGTFIGAYIGNKSLYRAIGLGVIFLPITLIFCGIHDYLILSYTLVISLGIFANIGDGPMWTLLQKFTPQESSGRVFATVDVLSVAGMSLGSLITGILIDKLAFQYSLLTFGGIILLLSIYSTMELMQKSKKEEDIVGNQGVVANDK
ncbi:MFS transporter [Lysinibacillus xylanilyticus]|uniref:Major facilitator superfamily (MFS) profile domain-containing protein n=1 Tax=Lysinibacillus xylanilyticus TaxID=582475 RepID=A0A2M9Q5R1_9BACI|nr:MFS transporter [Lysinibacillus xylanilyticus]PJO43416.1 hypothetical protein CWD94_12770 [Lysinibacillus xylanilyticus]